MTDTPYRDPSRAAAYARLGIINTYYLAYRDLPGIFDVLKLCGVAIDYGCATGRSTRFLRENGLRATGVDISDAIIALAHEQDPGGDFRLIRPGDLRCFSDDTFDLCLSVMPFDSIATRVEKVATLNEISRVLKAGGCKILVAASPQIHQREWVSFSSVDFPGDRSAGNGDVVRVVITDTGDQRAVEDTLWTEDAYLDTSQSTPLQLVSTHHPVAMEDDIYACDWVSERRSSSWTIFVLRKPSAS